MIINKELYKDRPEIYFMLSQLEIAVEKGDYFSTSVLVTRLKKAGLSLQKACTEEEAVVQ